MKEEDLKAYLSLSLSLSLSRLDVVTSYSSVGGGCALQLRQERTLCGVVEEEEEEEERERELHLETAAQSE